jgi:hypothetical protein
MASDLSPEEEASFLAGMPPRPKLLAVPPWHGGGVPTRDAYTDDEFEAALLNFHKHRAVKEHNARLLQAHDAAVDAYIRASARKDVERRAVDPHAARIAELKARLEAVDGELERREAETRPLSDEQMERLRGMTRIPEDAESLSTAEYAAARQRATKAARLLEMEQRFAADEKRNARR